MNDDAALVPMAPDEKVTPFLDLEDWTPGEPIAGLVAEQRTICPD
jgi:hypothetical protein